MLTSAEFIVETVVKEVQFRHGSALIHSSYNHPVCRHNITHLHILLHMHTQILQHQYNKHHPKINLKVYRARQVYGGYQHKNYKHEFSGNEM